MCAERNQQNRERQQREEEEYAARMREARDGVRDREAHRR